MPALNRARLVASLREHLPDIAFRYDGWGAITVPAAHPAVGDLAVYLDDDEVTVIVGEHHFHVGFTAAMVRMPSDEATDGLSTHIVRDLADIFQGRTTFPVSELRFWRQRSGRLWEWPLAVLRKRTCRWTGPLR